MKRSSVFKPALFLLIGTSLFTQAIFTQADSQLNPNYIYIYKGEPLNRGISLGDPDNWSLSVSGREGTSAGGSISVKPISFKDTADAIQLTWHKKSVQGNFSVYGSNIDLSKYKDAVSLTIDMRIDEKPKADVKIGMDCGYPCRAEIKINKMIKAMKQGEWFSLPIPLNCFKSDNFDLSKINGPFTISTSSKFTISITNVRLEKMAEGEKGCAKDK
jgi:hypothetical protein